MGSSPLARGSLLPQVTDAGDDGLIPARAGLTVTATASTSVAGAHPRSRGAHAFLPVVTEAVSGSSPLARGSPGPRSAQRPDAGLIPARAGLTTASTCPGWSRRAHPRSRGAHNGEPTDSDWRVGSSPLARGSPETSPDSTLPSGLIPARAGLTSWTGHGSWPAGAHPRSRGAHLDSSAHTGHE